MWLFILRSKVRILIQYLRPRHIRLCCFMEVQESNKIKAPPNLRRSKHTEKHWSLGVCGVRILMDQCYGNVDRLESTGADREPVRAGWIRADETHLLLRAVDLPHSWALVWPGRQWEMLFPVLRLHRQRCRAENDPVGWRENISALYLSMYFQSAMSLLSMHHNMVSSPVATDE